MYFCRVSIAHHFWNRPASGGPLHRGAAVTIILVPNAIHIFTAVELEARFIAKALGLRSDGNLWIDGEQTITCRAIGIRAVKMPPPEAVRGARCIILAGFAGALDPALKVGDVVLEDGPLSVEFAGRRGCINTSRQIISTPKQKSDLFAQTGALAVDMEGDAVKAWAAEAGVPIIAVRAISDSAAQSLDPSLLRLVDSTGRPKPMALAKALLRRPALVGDLLRLRAASNLAGLNLGKAVCGIVEQITHSSSQLS